MCFCLGHVGILARGRRTNNTPLTSAAGCLECWVGKKTFFLPRSSGALSAWKENANNAPLASAAGCLEFGAGSKMSFCLGHIGLLTC